MALTNEGGDAIVSPITELISPEAAELSEILDAPSAAPDVPTSRTICLRSLRGTNTAVPSSSAPSDAARPDMSSWGKPTIASLGLASSPVVVAAGEGQNVDCKVPMANKVVDLREVKKARPGPLATSKGIESEEPEESSSGSGPMKLDVSACKRMIQYQLKKNAAEERREAMRNKVEKERACAAEAEETQRTLEKIEARIEAQRRGPFSMWKNGSHAEFDDEFVSGGPRGVCSIPEDDLRELSSKHGLVVKFVDDGEASGVEQVRALARAHGIRIEILDGNDEGGPRLATPATLAALNDVTTPPPMLSSLNVKPKVPVVAGTKRMIGTSSLRKAAPASTTQAPSPSIADPERIGDNDSVAKGGVSAATAEKKRRQPTDDCVQIEKREGDLCEGGNSIVETKAMPVAISASKRMRCANPDGRVASQPDSSAVISTRSMRRSSTGTVSWTPGNNKLFEGAMAGILGRRKPGRGKRP